MLVLSRTGDSYLDDANPAVRYRLPSGILPLQGPDGAPQVALSRSRDGGLLHLRLRAAWPALAATERRVSFVDGRFRLLLQTPIARETGQWRPTPVVGDAVVERSVSLTPVEAAIAGHLGQRTDDLVDVEVELRVQGLAPAFPWLASAALDTLRPRIAALLHASPAAWPDVEAAFLGLTEDTFTWYPLKPGAMRPPLDQALRAIAHHTAPILMTSSADGWVLTDTGPPRVDVSLNVPGIQSETIGLRWSFSQFLASQADPRRHLVDLSNPGPFAASVISVVNDLPLAPEGIRSISVEVRTGGPSGLLHHEFLPGEPASARLTFVSETFDASNVQWRARYTVMTGNGPVVDGTDFRLVGQTIEINSDTLSLSALRFAVEPEIFDYVAALEVNVGTRTLILTRAAPQSWAVGRRPPATVSVIAVLGAGERFPLGAFSVGRLGVTLDLRALGIGETTTITVSSPADLDRRAAYLAVQVEGWPWRTLDRGGRMAVPSKRNGRWQPPRLKYRTRHVALDANGATSVIAESAWREASGDAITVDL